MPYEDIGWAAASRPVANPRSGLRTAVLTTVFSLAATLAGCGGGEGTDAHLAAAREAIDADAYDAASLQLNNALQSRPGDSEIRLLLARVALIAGRSSVTERQARAVARIDQDPTRGRQLLCEALLARGAFDSILSEYVDDASDFGLSCRATAHLHLGNFADASRLFTETLYDAPGFAPAVIGLAKTNQALGRYQIAKRQLNDLLKESPLDIAAHKALAAVQVDMGQLADAELTLVDAIGLPRDLTNTHHWLSARVSLAEVRWRLGRQREATTQLDELVEQFPSNPLPKYLRALFAYENADYRLAREYLRSVLNIVPDHEPSKKLSAAADLAQGQFGSAQIRFSEQWSEWSSDPLMNELLSRIYLGMGNAHESVAVITRAPLDTLSAGALSHAGRAHALAGNYDAARKAYAIVLEQSPTNMDLQIRAAATALHAGDLAASDRAMANWPTNDKTQNARNVLRLLRFLRADDLDRAEKLAKRRRRDAPNDLISMLALAEVSERRGAREQALSWLQMARERNADAIEPRLLLADYVKRDGDANKMRDLAEEILAQRPFNAEALTLLGEASLLNGDAYAAIETFREASRVSPSSPNSAIELVRAQLAAGDFWQARRDIKNALVRGSLEPLGIAGLAIEEHRRGNREQANALADDLLSLDKFRSIGLELLGDLNLLDGDYKGAASAYERANRHTAGRRPAFKAALAGHAGKRRSALNPLQTWVRTKPRDRQMQRVLRRLESNQTL